MRFLQKIIRKIRLLARRRRLSRLRRSPKIFVPFPSHFQVVVPFKTVSVFLIIFLILTSAYLLLRSDVFLVKDFRVEKVPVAPQQAAGQGQQQRQAPAEFVSIKEVQETLLPLVARSIFTISTADLKRKLKSEFLAIAKVEVEKELPDRLSVKFSERVPLAVVKVPASQAEDSFLVDQEGLLFARSEAKTAADLPILELSQEQNLGLGNLVSSEQVLAAITVIKTPIDASHVRLNKLVLQEGGVLEAHYSEGLVVLFDTESKKASEQISSLQTLYHQAKIEARKLNRVDFRFERPVVS